MTREEYFCNNYIDKIYYYYLKKTGNTDESNDLAGEVALEILKALSGGVTTTNFSAWVWTIVRNRYAKWAAKKHIRLENEDIVDISEIDIASPELVEDKLLQVEQINELRRELSLIHKEYREIIVAYYVENKSIAEISKKLSVPEGTVKTKLFKGRQRLKEGMLMARTFGKLSYAPEDIEFCQSGGRSDRNEPDIYIWDSLHGKICKNILIAAYRNPIRIQELSIELGISMPYIEPFVEEMTEATLLVRNGTKSDKATYETNFAIISREALRKMNDKLASI
jgi:RNA polymerase sigma factor (sigma-70 family)